MPFGTEIIEWYGQLRSRYFNFFTTGQEIVDYMMPSHRDITYLRAVGQRKTQKIYDSTAPNSIFLLASFLQGSIFPQDSQWFDARHQVAQLNANPEIASFLQDARKAQLSSFADSNFYSTTLEYVTDWITFGNCCLLQERVDLNKKKPQVLHPLVFTALGFGSYVFFEDDNKRPGGLIRELEMSASECIKKWGDACSDTIRTTNRDRPFWPIKILHAILPRELVKYKRLATPKDMPWASCWFEFENPKHPSLEESGYPEKPFAIARYNVIAGEVMGRGLGEIALPDVKTLNDATRRGFLEWDKTLDPPLNRMMGQVIGDITHKPGGQNIIKRPDAITLMDKDLRVRNQTHEWNLEDRRKAVKEVFFTDMIHGLLAAEEQPRNQTAYQYAKRLELMHLIMAPTGGRLQTEGLRDIIETNYSILYRTGGLPEMPDVLKFLAQTEQGNKTQIVYESPLAKVQREEEINGMREFLNDIMQQAQAHPEVVDIPNMDKFMRHEAEIKGLQYMLNDEAKTDEIRQLKAKMQQLQQSLMAAEQASKAVKNVTPMMTAGAKANGGPQDQAA